jgi:hypothetical protein
MFVRRELMFAAREHVSVHRELMFAVREHKLPRVKYRNNKLIVLSVLYLFVSLSCNMYKIKLSQTHKQISKNYNYEKVLFNSPNGTFAIIGNLRTRE